ncbi:MAG: aminotransferase class IV [Propioniciclava sp.]
MTGPHHDYRLLETLAAVDGQARHAALHLDRLAASSRALGFACDRTAIATRLAGQVAGELGLRRVRILLSRTGSAEIQVLTQEPPPGLLRAALAREPLDSTHPLLGHKTTERGHLSRLAVPGAEETVLFNERGELTEFTYGSLALAIAGCILTPALSCGLLPGIERRRALASGRIREAVLRVDDLFRAEQVWHLNSLRGWTECRLGPGGGAAAASRPGFLAPRPGGGNRH